ncbi:MAG: tyrosinase family protein [Bacteroidota bacterium]
MKKLNLFFGLLLCLLLSQDLLADPIGRRVDIGTLSAAQRSTLAAAMIAYIDKAIIDEHACNTEFGNAPGASGSIHGPEMFLNWHREYIAEMEEAIQATLLGMGLTVLPRWNPANGINDVLDFLVVDGDCSISCGGGTCAAPIAANFPNGVNTAFPAVFDSPLTCGTWTDMEVFSDALNFNYHGVGHIAAGGVMSNFRSPSCPLFFLWHSMVDEVFWDYQM